MALVYRTIYRGEFCDKSGDNIFFDFKRRMDDSLPVPTIIPIIFTGEERAPVVISYPEKDGYYLLNPLNGSTATFNIKAIGDFELSSMYTADEKEWFVDITGAWKWSGFIIPDSCNEPYESKPYDVSIKATDALGTLSTIPFKNGGELYIGFETDITVLTRALAFTGLHLPILCAINTYEASMNMTVDPLYQTFIDTDRFHDLNGVAFSCEEVIRSILARWGARLHQFNGYWQIVNVLEKANGNVAARIFDLDGFDTGDDTIIGNSITAGGIDRDLIPTNSYTNIAKALASSTAYYQYGYPSNQLINGNFNNWPIVLLLPPGWVKDGDIVVNRGVNANDPTDYYIILDAPGEGFLRNDTPVQIRAAEKVSVSFDLYVPTGHIGVLNRTRFMDVIIRNDYGWYYTGTGWQNGFGYYGIGYKSSDLIGQKNVSFDIAPFSIDGNGLDYELTIGFRVVQTTADNYFTTYINNVSVRPSTVAGQAKPPVGIFNRQEGVTAQTYRRDAITILHGDDDNEQRTSLIKINNTSFPTTWERADYTEARNLLSTIANTELTLHQRPYKIFEGDFDGFGYIDINTLLTIDLSPGNYIFLHGDFNLKKSQRHLVFAEALTDPLGAGDVIETIPNIEDYGDAAELKGVSVANPAGVNPSDGGATIDLSGYAKIADVPVKANNTETQAGTDDDKFVTPFTLANWWSYIKGLAQTISGAWNFTARPTYNGGNLLISSDLPLIASDSETQTGSNDTKIVSPLKLKNWWTWIKTQSQTFSSDLISNRHLSSVFGGKDTSGITITTNTSNTSADIIFTSGATERGRLKGSGGFEFVKLLVTTAPVNTNDVVRLADLQSFVSKENFVTKTASYTVLLADFGTSGELTIEANATSGAIIITCPTAITMKGYTLNVVKSDSSANSVSVKGNGSELINAANTDVLSTIYQAGTYKSNGTKLFKF